MQETRDKYYTPGSAQYEAINEILKDDSKFAEYRARVQRQQEQQFEAEM